MADFFTPSPLTIEENIQTLNMAHLGPLPFTNSGTSLKDQGKKRTHTIHHTMKTTSLAFKQIRKQNLLAMVGQPIDSSSYFTPTFVGKFSYTSLLKAR